MMGLSFRDIKPVRKSIIGRKKIIIAELFAKLLKTINCRLNKKKILVDLFRGRDLADIECDFLFLLIECDFPLKSIYIYSLC